MQWERTLRGGVSVRRWSERCEVGACVVKGMQVLRKVCCLQEMSVSVVRWAQKCVILKFMCCAQ